MKNWTYSKRMHSPNEDRHLVKELTFTEAVEEAIQYVEPSLINIFPDSQVRFTRLRMVELVKETRQYFKTGNCGQVDNKAASVNPTFLQPTTGKWFLHHQACPFHSYLSLRMELDAKNVKHGMLADYCRTELTKLLTAFRQRMGKIMFYFHPCDALAFCYGDLPYKFDLIDTSTLADSLGLANLLNAAGRKLLSDRSLLFIESIHWSGVATSVAQYAQEMLCCPLSLVPTLYGLRLMDKVEWGQEAPYSTLNMSAMSTRLRWKKAMPFDQVSLDLSSPLKMCLQQLMHQYSTNESLASSLLHVAEKFFSPLTFCYVLSDLIRRGGIQDPSSLMTTFISTVHPVFQKSFETFRAWMENRAVWRVNLRSQTITVNSLSMGKVQLRLALVPTNNAPTSESTASADFTDLHSTVNHFIDNVQFSVEIESSGLIESVGVAFLLEDRSLLESHCGVVITSDGMPVFYFGPLSDSQHTVEPFTRRYPWHFENPTAHPSDSRGSNKSRLIAESCQETEDTYTIRFKILPSKSKKPPSGKFPFCYKALHS